MTEPLKTDTAPNSQEILEKYDRESVTRTPKSSTVRYIIGAIAVLYSLFHLNL